MNRRASRNALRALSTFGLVFAMAFTGLATWSIADERRGAETVADVVDVEHRGARTFLTVRFSTNHGELCQTRLRVRVDANHAVSTGEQIRIHHAKSDPCLRVREAGDHSAWLITLASPVLLIAFAVFAFVAWRQPRSPLPRRYAGMP